MKTARWNTAPPVYAHTGNPRFWPEICIDIRRYAEIQVYIEIQILPQFANYFTIFYRFSSSLSCHIMPLFTIFSQFNAYSGKHSLNFEIFVNSRTALLQSGRVCAIVETRIRTGRPASAQRAAVKKHT